MILSFISFLFASAFFCCSLGYAKWIWEDRKRKLHGYFPHFFFVLSFLLGWVMVYISTLGG